MAIKANKLWGRLKIFRNPIYFRIIFRNPSVIVKLFKNYIKILIFREKVLRITDIAVTFACNANCQHCCSTGMVNKERELLSIDEIKACIKQAADLGSIIFNFLGGEPLVYNNIYEAISFVKRNGALAGLSTNGLLLTEGVVAKLKSAGLDVIQVDLESVNPGELDEIRGVSGCYERIFQGINLLKKTGIQVILSTIMTKKNIANGDIWKIVQTAKDLGAIINVNCSAKVGNWANNPDSLLSVEELRIFEEIIKLRHTRWAGSTNYMGEFCPCGTEKIFITAYGDVIPCGLIAVSYGNIRKESLKDIWGKMFANYIKKRKKRMCRAAFDEEIFQLNSRLYANAKKLPVSIDEVPD